MTDLMKRLLLGLDEPAWRNGTLLFARIAVAFVFLWHGVPKAIHIGWAMEKFVGFGLPGVFGPLVGWAEVVFGLLLLVGAWHRVSSLALAVIIVTALAVVQVPGVLSQGDITAGFERDLLLLAATLLLACFGPGAFALGAAGSAGGAGETVRNG